MSARPLVGRVYFCPGCHPRSGTMIAKRSGKGIKRERESTDLGPACNAAGDPGLARHHWQQALALYTGLGSPEAGEVRGRLVSLDEG